MDISNKRDYNVMKIDANKRKQFDLFYTNRKLLLEAINGKQNIEEFIKTYWYLQLSRRWSKLDWHFEWNDEKEPLQSVQTCKFHYIFMNSRLISPLHVTVEITEKCNLYYVLIILNASCNKQRKLITRFRLRKLKE